MTKKDDLKKYQRENGYLFSKDISDRNVNRFVLREAIKYNGIERVAHGIYVLDETIPDYYYILSVKNSKIVFSHESALYLNNLMEHEPNTMTITIPRGYNATHLRNKRIKVVSKDKEVYELGITIVKTVFGNDVRTYNLERTICEMIRCKNKTDIQIYTYALKEYFKRHDKDLVRLIQYSKILKVEDEVRQYIEVLM